MHCTYDGELDVCGTILSAPLIDILNPLLVVREAIRGNTDQLYAALLKVRRPEDRRGAIVSVHRPCPANNPGVDTPPRDLSELGGTDGGEIAGVGEEDGLAAFEE